MRVVRTHRNGTCLAKLGAKKNGAQFVHEFSPHRFAFAACVIENLSAEKCWRRTPSRP
jgi:hypothetical protein